MSETDSTSGRQLKLAESQHAEMLELSKKALSLPGSGAYGGNLIEKLLLGATSLPSSQINKYVENLKKRNPEASPERIVDILSAQFKNLLGTTGGAVGATAAIPTIGTGTALVLTGADLALFFAASAVYSLAVAEVHGISSEDPERRKALVLASVLGTSGAKTVSSLGSVPIARWGTALMTTMPKSSIKQVNTVLKSRFIKRKLAAHSGLALGRVVPFGIGAVIGLSGGRALANTVIAQSKSAFGPTPTRFTDIIEVRAAGSESTE